MIVLKCVSFLPVVKTYYCTVNQLLKKRKLVKKKLPETKKNHPSNVKKNLKTKKLR